MNIITIKILVFCLVPIGLMLLYLSVKSLRSLLFGAMAAELPYLNKTTSFYINEVGKYSIWHKGVLLQKVPVTQFKPIIKHIETGKIIALKSSVFRPSVNGFDKARVLLFHFNLLDKGEYNIQLAAGSSISKLEKFISNLIPLKESNLSQYTIQIRKSQPFYITMVSILFTIFSALVVIGGFVVSLLAEQILC
ncbi:hypothetical protein H7F37_05480 [Winogradskyella sp. PAMC22761]|nr:hypothetical protein H7F37_05480 [Winogradskyella sp. PAMC22761]